MMTDSTIDKITLKLQTGKTPPSKEEKYFNGELNWYTPSDLNKKLLSKSRRTITKLAYEEKKATIYPKGTVLLSCIGDIGKLGIVVDDTSSSNQQITGLIPNTDKVTSEYLYYWCLAHKKVFESKSTLGTLPMLNNKRLRKIKISYDKDKNEQVKIANLLTQVEALITKREESIELLNELLKSTFLDIFGDPVLNSKEWNTKLLEDIVTDDCSITYGIVQPGEEFTNGVPIVRPVDLSNDPIKVMGLKCIDPKISKKYDRTLLNGDELLLTVRGTVGDIGLATKGLKGVNVTRGITPLRFSTDIDKTFYYYQLKSKPMQNKIQTYVKGAALRQINLKDLRKLKLIVPSENNTSIITNFSEKANKIESMKSSYEDSLYELKELFDSLSQRAFKGELPLDKINMPVGIKVSDVRVLDTLSSSGAGDIVIAGQESEYIQGAGDLKEILDVPVFMREINIDKHVEMVKTYTDDSNNPVYSKDFLWTILQQSDDDISYESINSKLEKYSFKIHPEYNQVQTDIFALIEEQKLIQVYDDENKKIVLSK